jgi:uncharacterized membrane protein
MNRVCLAAGAAALCLAAGVTSAGASQLTYRVRVLPTPEGFTRPFVSGINERGDVIGWADRTGTEFPESHGFFWPHGPASAPVEIGAGLFPSDLNDAGQVVADTGGGSLTGAVVWQDGHASVLASAGDLEPLTVRGINNAGVIAGDAGIADFIEFHGALWQAAHPDRAPRLIFGADPSSDSGASDVNDLGQVLGGRGAREVIWQNGRVIHRLPRFFGGQIINNRTVVAGSRTVGGVTHAALWRNGRLTDLGGSPSSVDVESFANGLNDYNRVVGGFLAPDQHGVNHGHAFIWRGGHMRRVDRFVPAGLGWRIVDAGDINDKGQIAAIGVRNGHRHVVMLSPMRG